MTILKKAPEGANVLDLEAGRLSRAEIRAGKGEGDPYLKLKAGYVRVKPEIPIVVAFLLEAEKIEEALKGLLVDPDDLDALLEDGLTKDDLEGISALITGKSLGESLASPTL
jgi:hypothetical protein